VRLCHEHSGVIRAFLRGAVVFSSLVWGCHASAQTAVSGFAVERLTLAAPGSNWIVSNDLKLSGGLRGAMALSTGYAHQPLTLERSNGQRPLQVVSGQASVDVGVAVMFDRLRLSLWAPNLAYGRGTGGRVGNYQYHALAVDPGKDPDTMSDLRLGLESRLLGAVDGTWRLGVGTTLFVPVGQRRDYATDGTYRGLLRGFLAGDWGAWRYAAQTGLHLRPRDGSPAPGSPRGHEVLFAAAFGRRWVLIPVSQTSVFMGAEVWGQTAVNYAFNQDSTGLEGMLTGVYETVQRNEHRLRAKVGFGTGIRSEFGTPEWRAVLGVEWQSL
jgi:hypothetical protein